MTRGPTVAVSLSLSLTSRQLGAVPGGQLLYLAPEVPIREWQDGRPGLSWTVRDLMDQVAVGEIVELSPADGRPFIGTVRDLHNTEGLGLSID